MLLKLRTRGKNVFFANRGKWEVFLKRRRAIKTKNQEGMSQFASVRSEEELHWFDVMRTLLLYGDFLDMEIER
jgi:hypothetical protein